MKVVELSHYFNRVWNTGCFIYSTLQRFHSNSEVFLAVFLDILLCSATAIKTTQIFFTATEKSVQQYHRRGFSSL